MKIHENSPKSHEIPENSPKSHEITENAMNHPYYHCFGLITTVWPYLPLFWPYYPLFGPITHCIGPITHCIGPIDPVPGTVPGTSTQYPVPGTTTHYPRYHHPYPLPVPTTPAPLLYSQGGHGCSPGFFWIEPFGRSSTICNTVLRIPVVN